MLGNSEKEPVISTGEIPLLKNNNRKVSPLKIIIRVILVLFILTVIGVTGVFFVAKSLLEPVNPEATEELILISVPQGVSTGQIAIMLEEEGVIQNAFLFRLYLRYTDADATLMAGDYQLSPSMTPGDIIGKLKRGDVYIETDWFVVPEGYDILRIARYLEEEGLADESEFLRMAQSPPDSLLERFPFLKEVPQNVDFVLEGYLFPSRYEIISGATPEDIIVLMLNRFQRFLTDDNLKRMDQLGMSILDVVTLASIVEREAASDKEWDLVSSVFHNRLNINMRLQSCATIQYILGEVKEVLLYEDLEVESPYNTYKNPGLPPGPISSPGDAALKAVLYPAETDYFYFVSKGDGSGEHYFSATLAEHNASKAKAGG